jgi:CheY-like chemotaxis protein
MLCRAEHIAPRRRATKRSRVTVEPELSLGLRRRILVVDDSEDAAWSLAIVLQFSGHEVRVAHGGLAAIEITAEFRPEAIFLDIGMPNRRWFDTAPQIRAQPWGQPILICAVTGFDGLEHARRSYEAGIDRHFTKRSSPMPWALCLLRSARVSRSRPCRCARS